VHEYACLLLEFKKEVQESLYGSGQVLRVPDVWGWHISW